MLLHLLELSRAFLLLSGELLGPTNHDTTRELGARTFHTHQTLLFCALRLPLGAMFRSHRDLLFGVVLFVIHRSLLVRLLDETDTFFALGTFDVIHAFSETVQFAFLLLTRLDLFLNSILHDGSLVEDDALLEDNRRLFASALGLLGEQLESLLFLFFLHFRTNSLLFASTSFLFEALGLVFFVLALRGDALSLFLLFLLSGGALGFLLAALDDHLARQRTLVFGLDGGAQFGTEYTSADIGGCLGRELAHAFLQKTSGAREVRLDETRLEAIADKVHRSSLVVDSNGNVITSNRLYENTLDFVIRHERHGGFQRINLHRLEHLGLLVHHANNAERSQSR